MTCYRNNFPENYAQYNCGETGTAADVQTTYLGQASDLLLQRVYTGVVFSPMSAESSTTSQKPTSTKDTISETNTSTAESTPTASVTADGDNFATKTGAIAGGTIGGLAFLAIVLVGILFLLRRRRKHKHIGVGGFVR